ncbi:hypothetical protein ACWEQA_05780 [Nocardia sp. NPDC004085]
MTQKQISVVTARLLALIGIVAVWAVVFRYASSPTAIALIAVLMVAVLVQIVWRAAIRDGIPSPEVVGDAIDVDADIESVIERAIRVESVLPPQQLLHFTSRVIYPERSRLRVREVVEIQRSKTMKSVETTWRLPEAVGAVSETSYLPIAQPLKGRLFRNPSIVVSDGTEITPLTYRESLDIAVAALIATYRTAYNLSIDVNVWDPAHIRRIKRLVGMALQPAHFVRDAVRLADYTARIQAAMNLAPADGEAHVACQRLAHILLRRYLLVTTTAQCDRYWIKYTFDVSNAAVDRLPDKGEVSAFARAIFVKMLKQSYGYVSIRLNRAARAQSYHLAVRLPESSHAGLLAVDYVDGSAAGGWKQLKRSRRTYTVVSPGQVRIPKPGWPHLDIYTRDVSKSDLVDLRLRFRVFESPLTDVLSATWAIVTLIIVISLRSAVHTMSMAGDTKNDYIASALAYPLLVATAVTVYVNRQSKTYAPSISALVFGGSITAIGSAAVLLYFLTLASGDFKNVPGMLKFATSDRFWLLLVVCIAWIAILSASMASSRVLRLWMVRRRSSAA